ncbi:hypothetical protein Bca52824_075945 [Brassica carinata]|uniref:Uncharacterized protein n=1 Tax=Brassica carinata TaxID=52824 RepID=A0A8X7TX13_BRACI|nr:hypothetical protein Bca52824_075945 [Brassica carinata]
MENPWLTVTLASPLNPSTSVGNLSHAPPLPDPPDPPDPLQFPPLPSPLSGGQKPPKRRPSPFPVYRSSLLPLAALTVPLPVLLLPLLSPPFLLLNSWQPLLLFPLAMSQTLDLVYLQ